MSRRCRVDGVRDAGTNHVHEAAVEQQARVRVDQRRDAVAEDSRPLRQRRRHDRDLLACDPAHAQDALFKPFLVQRLRDDDGVAPLREHGPRVPQGGSLLVELHLSTEIDVLALDDVAQIRRRRLQPLDEPRDELEAELVDPEGVADPWFLHLDGHGSHAVDLRDGRRRDRTGQVAR